VRLRAAKNLPQKIVDAPIPHLRLTFRKTFHKALAARSDLTKTALMIPCFESLILHPARR